MDAKPQTTGSQTLLALQVLVAHQNNLAVRWRAAKEDSLPQPQLGQLIQDQLEQSKLAQLCCKLLKTKQPKPSGGLLELDELLEDLATQEKFSLCKNYRHVIIAGQPSQLLAILGSVLSFGNPRASLYIRKRSDLVQLRFDRLKPISLGAIEFNPVIRADASMTQLVWSLVTGLVEGMGGRLSRNRRKKASIIIYFPLAGQLDFGLK